MKRARSNSTSAMPAAKKRKTTNKWSRKKNSLSSAVKVYSFKRMTTLSDISVTSASAFSGAFEFRLQDLPSVTDFTNLFDQYMITWIKVELVPTKDTSLLSSSTATLFQVYSVIDGNDVTPLANVATAEAYATCKFTAQTKHHMRSFKPYLTLGCTDITATAFNVNTGPKWLSCTQDDVAHLGLKIVTDTNPSSEAYVYHVRATYWLKFRNVN